MTVTRASGPEVVSCGQRTPRLRRGVFWYSLCMEHLFCYGTLQDPLVQERVIGRRVAHVTDVLRGYTTETISEGGPAYLRALPNTESVLPGQVLTVSSEELEKIDAYEGALYARSRVTLQTGIEAWVYLRPKL